MISIAPLAGRTIGIVAPASPFETGKFETGLDVLKAMGFQIFVPGAVKDRTGYLAGSDHRRAALINELFADPDISAIWCARGGYGSMRILPFIDYELICSNPKPFVGASDVTALLTTLYSCCHIPVFHGPMIVSFADADERTRLSARQAFAAAERITIKAEPAQVLRPGSATGKVIGGNLTTLSHLMGTPFEPDFSGHLLFIEDIGEAPYRIDRMMTQMKMAGKLSHITGLLLGRFCDCGPMDEIHAIIKAVFQDLLIPILSGFPAGHGYPNLMLPMGVDAALDTDQGLLTCHMPPSTQPPVSSQSK